MKFILSFLFGFIFVLPVFATITQTCSTNSNNFSGCSVGCFLDEFGESPCAQCQSGTYNDGTFENCQPCPTGFDNGWSAQHKQHPDGASSCSDWECTDDYFPIDTNGDGTPDECSACDPTTLPDNAEFTDSCTWRCIIGYYKTNNTCTECPTGSTTTAAGATDISQCTCTGNFYMSGNNTCTACPSNTAECAGLSVDNVTCQTGLIKNIINGVVTCSSCPEHTQQSGNTCICSAGYYGDGDTCTACPAGTTTSSAGATSDADCHMTSNTKFYVSTGENYMLLIPSTATNIQ